MSQNPGDPSTEAARLGARLRELRALAGGQAAATRKKSKTFLIAGITVGVLVIIFFTNLTRQAFQFDSNAITQMGRHEIEKNLPSGRENLRSYLTTEAPRVVSQVVRSLLNAIPNLRPPIVQQTRSKTAQLTQQFEEQLVEELRVAITKSKEQIDAACPGANDVEKLEKLIATVTESFDYRVTMSLQAIYPEYLREIEGVRVYLESIRTKDASLLTPREKTQKEIIETMLRIAAQEQAVARSG